MKLCLSEYGGRDSGKCWTVRVKIPGEFDDTKNSEEDNARGWRLDGFMRENDGEILTEFGFQTEGGPSLSESVASGHCIPDIQLLQAVRPPSRRRRFQ